MMWLLLSCSHPADTAVPDPADPADPADTATPTEDGYLQVAAGGWFTCAIRSTDQGIDCWWEGPGALADFGQTAPPDGAFTHIAAGVWHACGIRVDGETVCWGQDTEGGTERLSAPDAALASLSAGMVATCGLTGDGALSCWGDPDSGLTLQADGVHAASAGPRGQCAASDDGVTCWGGHLSDSDQHLTDLAAGVYFTCGLTETGAAACWGDDLHGQQAVPAGSFSTITAGAVHACVLGADGGVCWGDDRYGQSAPAPDAIQLSAGLAHTCALLPDGTVACSGSAPDGAKADGEALSHAVHIQPIWDAHCIGCHTGDQLHKLSLLVEDAYANITGETGGALAEPGDPAGSRLVDRLESDGARMPPTHALPAEQRDRVRRWISEGMAP
ncbi:MAG: hypothetical protein ACI8RZ_003115 [Myxococcota bacterium]|jgi:hypothetical protein